MLPQNIVRQVEMKLMHEPPPTMETPRHVATVNGFRHLDVLMKLQALYRFEFGLHLQKWKQLGLPNPCILSLSGDDRGSLLNKCHQARVICI